MSEDLLRQRVWWSHLVIPNSRGIKDFQVSPGENLLFALTCLNSLLVFLPGILATSEWSDQQPDLALSTSSGGPCAVTFGCSLLLPWAEPWWGHTGAELSLVRLIALGAARLQGKEGMDWDSCYLHGVTASPWTLGEHKPTVFFCLLIHKFSIKAWHSCGLVRNIHLSIHSFFRPKVKSNILCAAIPKCIMLHFRVFQMFLLYKNSICLLSEKERK